VKVLIIQGAGMNMRGKVDIEIFGSRTLEQLNDLIRGYATDLGMDIEFASPTSRARWSMRCMTRTTATSMPR
jgi:3-dehydroquinate dehydratase